MMDNFSNVFHKYFAFVPAKTDSLRNEVFKLRYQVYCLETGFEDPADYPDHMESDVYDAHSAHYLIQHRASGMFAGTTRLILPPRHDGHLFPIEKHTLIDRQDLLEPIARHQLAEASRYCVSKAFKRRKFDAPNTLTGISPNWRKTVPCAEERRLYPLLSIALFACLIRMSCENSIHYWYAVMEPALIRFFTTLGIYFIAIGPLSDYHGERRPCLIKVSDLLKGVAGKNHDMWKLMTDNGNFVQ